jgi:non-specific protein-tyrosine kinase
MLSGRRVRQLLNEMGGHYDYVIVDSAPVLPVSDSVALAGSVDGLLVVAHAGRVTQPNVAETLERLERIGAPILGLVLNQASQQSKGYYAYGGYGAPPPSATTMQPQGGKQQPADFDSSPI